MMKTVFPEITNSLVRYLYLIPLLLIFSLPVSVYSNDFVLLNMGDDINSEYDECGVSIYKNDFYFSSNRDWLQKNDWNLYVAYMIGDIFVRMNDISELNTGYVDAGPSISEDGQALYFHSNRPGGFGKEDIYISEKVSDSWTEPQNPGNTINSYYIDATPFITDDGDKLFFSSDRPGGEGGLDIWVSVKEGDSWSKPYNLGPEVNTKYDEKYPFYVDDILFLSSNRKNPLGFCDLYFNYFIGDRPTRTYILKPPINTTGDELAIYVDFNDLSGYISSEREGGYGGVDIWKITLPSIYPSSYERLLRLFD